MELPHPEPVNAEGASVIEALSLVFSDHQRLKNYVLDDQDRWRKHVAIFIDEELACGDGVLESKISETSEIHLLQALSGG